MMTARNASFRKTISLRAVATAIALASAACVTVNVNFPEGAVQQATDDFVKDLYRAREDGKKKPTSASSPTAPSASLSNDAALPAPRPFPARLELMSSAYAAESFTLNTPAADAIRDKMRARVDEILAHKRSGALGESNDGLLTIQDSSKVKKLQAARIKQLVDSENADRAALYSSVLSANGLKADRLKDVKQSFARSFQAESPSGTWVQEADGKWSQKP